MASISGTGSVQKTNKQNTDNSPSRLGMAATVVVGFILVVVIYLAPIVVPHLNR